MTRREPRRFWNPTPTKSGRVGHPSNSSHKMIRCAGVIFNDTSTKTRWTLRIFDPYETWPGVTVWLMSKAEHPDHYGGYSAYGVNTVCPEADVPDEVREFAMANLVRFRLKGMFA